MSCEKCLFTWDGFDFVSDTALIFYNCELIVDIGEHKAGAKFDCIMTDPEHGKIVFQRLDANKQLAEEHIYRLLYAVGAKIEKVTDNDEST